MRFGARAGWFGPALWLAACTVSPRPATGVASWYGDELAGRPTATGEPFDPAGLTAAHRTLPLGSLALVTALGTGRAVVVRINDRGPWRGDRLIDLSRGAARLLGVVGLARVRVEPAPPGALPGLFAGSVDRPPSVMPQGRYWVQVATFADEGRAQALAARLGATVVPGGDLYRVRIGPLADAEEARAARDAMAARGYGDARLLTIP